ncbi:T9SS type A sorting domain-containing protein [Aurantibacillus circumpalustris]|uniref:T9SS type A sorting domain-containing protein n=1 Tax=Aurantibacillus circumpalustris TaxID=3036359 RepID=UPI00295AD4AA|nr:T9SS type A sorting domain-containing protein [Aurantibacillus circumpalustris]
MRQFYSLFFSILFFTLNSQTLTQSFNEPVVGDIDKLYRLDTSAYTSGLPVNTTGNTCIWNYSNLLGSFPLVVDSFVAPSAAIGATANPGTTFAQHRDLLYTFYKSTTSPSQTELLGAYSPSLTLTFTNSAIIATYPVNFGYNLADPVSGSFKYNTTTGACNGNITISAPGSGTINFPNNISIPNVLCLKSVEILTLSVGIAPLGTFKQTIYNYYMPGKKFPILNINYTTYGLLGNPPTTTAYIYGSNNYYVAVGIDKNTLSKEDYRVYPNPFHERLYLTTENKNENEFLLYSLNGKLLAQEKSLDNLKTENLDAGIYILEIKNESGTYHQKIIKE